jgi:signal transduction histidine kinase
MVEPRRAHDPGGSPLDLLDTPLAFAALDGAIQLANRAFRAWTESASDDLAAVLGIELGPAVTVMARKPYAVRATGRSPRGRAIPVEYQLRLAVYDGEEIIVVEGRDLSRVHEKEAMLQAFSKTIEVNNRLLASQKTEIAGLLDEVHVSYAAVQRLLDATDQGFVTLDRDARVLVGRSAAFDRWFDAPPVGARFVDCLERLDPDVAVMFELLWSQLADDVLTIDVVVEMLPVELRGGARSYRMSYKPALDDAGALVNLLVVITDVTDEIERERAEAQQTELSNLLARFASDHVGFAQFVAEADALIAVITAPVVDAVELFRAVHTLKGNCALFGAQVIAACCHELEDQLSEHGDAVNEAARRALGDSWRALRQRIGVFLEHGGDGVWVARDELDDLRRKAPALTAEQIARALESWTWDPAARRLARLGSQARELAARLERGPVEVVIDGGGLRFDPTRWNALWLSLVHLVLNSIDHGLEPVDERVAAGKPARARLELRATCAGGQVILEIADDGRGIDWQAVARAAAARGLDTSSNEALGRALFVDGLSTRDEISPQSGRGIGLAAVRAACDRLGGTIEIESEPGRGTRFRFRLPAVGVAAAQDDDRALRRSA